MDGLGANICAQLGFGAHISEKEIIDACWILLVDTGLYFEGLSIG